jgi:hypothetical protein
MNLVERTIAREAGEAKTIAMMVTGRKSTHIAGFSDYVDDLLAGNSGAASEEVPPCSRRKCRKY